MTVQIIKATIDGITRKNAKTGDAGLSIVLKYEDGSEWGKKIYQWLWFGDDLRDNQKDDIKEWASLAEPGCDLDRAKEIVAGQSWILFGIVVDLQVDQENDRFWKIINFALEDSLPRPTVTTPSKDDIPF